MSDLDPAVAAELDAVDDRCSLSVGGSIGSISASPDRRHLAVGGRDVFKIFSMDLLGGASAARGVFELSKNLRGKNSNQTSSTNDVKWNPLPECRNLVCTAATNGAVVVWHIDAASSRQDRVYNDHERTVNRVAWHPTDGPIFLSGSQDGAVKMFDHRSKVGCVATFLGKSSTVPVRDVQFNPFASHTFAAAFDSGVVQLWDTRRINSAASPPSALSASSSLSSVAGPERSWVAHQGLVLGVDWHPADRGLLATCSRDRSVKVWDLQAGGDAPLPQAYPATPSSMSSQPQNMRPKTTIQTIASVGRVAWRTGGPSRRQQLASASALMDFKLHVWDIHRPYVPLASCLGHKDVVTSFLWVSDGDACVTGGKDGRLMLHHVARAYHPSQHLRTSTISIDVRGNIAMSHDPIQRSSVEEYVSP